MNTIRFIVFSAFATFSLSACKKESYWPEPIIPEATQTGQNTAGARVDGKSWSVQSDAFAGDGTKANYLRIGAKRKLVINLNRYTAEGAPFAQTHIYFSVPDIKSPGTVLLNQYADPFTPPANPAYAQFSTPGLSYITSQDATGVLVVTRLDTVALIVSGTFEFKARIKNSVQEVKITEGRFDIKLNP